MTGIETIVTIMSGISFGLSVFAVAHVVKKERQGKISGTARGDVRGTVTSNANPGRIAREVLAETKRLRELHTPDGVRNFSAKDEAPSPTESEIARATEKATREDGGVDALAFAAEIAAPMGDIRNFSAR